MLLPLTPSLPHLIHLFSGVEGAEGVARFHQMLRGYKATVISCPSATPHPTAQKHTGGEWA